MIYASKDKTIISGDTALLVYLYEIDKDVFSS